MQSAAIDAPHFLLQVSPGPAMDAIVAFLKGARRVLIATATAGGGHLAAAAALEEAWRKLYPQDCRETRGYSRFHASQLYRKALCGGKAM